MQIIFEQVTEEAEAHEEEEEKKTKRNLFGSKKQKTSKQFLPENRHTPKKSKRITVSDVDQARASLGSGQESVKTFKEFL